MEPGNLTWEVETRITDVERLVKEQDRAAQRLTNIDNKIIAIQRSTRTDLPFMIPLHNYLRMKFRWYYNWHMSQYSSRINWLILLTVVFVSLFSILK